MAIFTCDLCHATRDSTVADCPCTRPSSKEKARLARNESWRAAVTDFFESVHGSVPVEYMVDLFKWEREKLEESR